MSKMTWLDLYNFLNQQANEVKNFGKFPWQEQVHVFDFATLGYYPTDFIQMPDNRISFSVDTTQEETISGSSN